MSLRYRIAVIIFALELGMMAFVLHTSLSRTSDQVLAQQRRGNETIARLLEASAREALLTEEFDRVQAGLGVLLGDPRVNRAVLADARGTVVAAGPPRGLGAAFAGAGEPGWTTVPIETELGTIGSLHVQFSDAAVRSAIRDAERWGAATAFGGMAFIAIVGVVIGSLLTRRLRDIAAVADRIADGDLAARAALPGKDEVAALSRAIDAMADRLEAGRLQAERRREALQAEVEQRVHAQAAAEEREEVLQVLYGATASPALSFDRRVGAMIDRGLAHLKMTAGWLAQIEGERHRVLLARGRVRREPGDARALSDTLAADVVEMGTTVVFQPGDRPVPAERLEAAEGIQAYVGVPVLIRGTLYAVLEFGVDEVARPIRDSDRLLVELMARWVGAQLEQNELQTRLVVADRLASVGTLAAGVAHEINNPLQFVLSNLELCLNRPAVRADPQLVDLMADARTGGMRIRDIVASLRTAAGSPAGQADTGAQLSQVVDFAVRIAGAELRPVAQVDVDIDDALHVVGSGTELMQVFVNLIVNAAHALEGRAGRDNSVRIAGRRDGDVARIEVTDTGAGMSSAVQARVFDPFYTTKRDGKGTGLGLFLCHQLITRLGGSIVVDSVVGAGTTVKITLPVATPGPAAAPAGEPQDAASGLRILVVDDEPLIRGLLNNILREHEVALVGGVDEALEALGYESDAPRSFDVVFCDLMMPNRSGQELYEIVRGWRPEQAAKFVLMTGGAVSAGAEEFLEQVEVSRLSKPFTLADIDQILRQADTADQGETA